MNLSLEIDRCFLKCSNRAHYCHWNSRSWVENWTLGLMVEGLGPRKYFGGLYTYKMAYSVILYVMGNCLH